MVSDAALREGLCTTPLKEHGGDWYSLRFEAMGTACRISFAAASRARARSMQQEWMHWLASFEIKYSRYRPDSMISRLNEAAGGSPVEIDEDLENMFQLCDWFHWVTHGLFDPTLLPLIRLWDYHAPHPVIPSNEAIAQAKALVGWRDVQRENGCAFLPREGMAIDTDGFGKEYAVDKALEMAVGAGCEHLVIDFGQDVRVLGTPAEGGQWRIGLEHPEHPGRSWRGLVVENMAVATSGDYLRNFESGGARYGHILDPRTGRPVAHEGRSVSVVAPTCAQAGILSTAAFVLGPEEGPEFLETCDQVEGCMWNSSHCIQTSRFDQYVLDHAHA